MMSGHGQIGRQERSLTQHSPMSDNISGLPPPPPFPSKWISYVYHPLFNPIWGKQSRKQLIINASIITWFKFSTFNKFGCEASTSSCCSCSSLIHLQGTPPNIIAPVLSSSKYHKIKPVQPKNYSITENFHVLGKH